MAVYESNPNKKNPNNQPEKRPQNPGQKQDEDPNSENRKKSSERPNK